MSGRRSQGLGLIQLGALTGRPAAEEAVHTYQVLLTEAQELLEFLRHQ